MEQIYELLGGFIIILGAVSIVYIIAKYTWLIKKMMLEKGIKPQPLLQNVNILDVGIILFFLGLGVLLCAFYPSLNLDEDTTDLLVWGTILIAGSLGPLSIHLLRK